MEHAVIIPAYNEEKNISDAVTRVTKKGYLPIVVDDCSKDRTAELAEKAGAIVLRHRKNQGKGVALKTAFKYILEKHPDIKYVAILDADLQYLPEDLPKIFKPLEEDKADYVTGYRNWKKDVPFRHRLGNFVWRTAFNIAFSANVKDSNCGFIAMTREVIKELVHVATGGYIIENMFMISVINKGFRIKQVPVKVYYYGVRDIKTGVRFVSGNLIYIIESGLKYRYNIDLKLYKILSKLKIIFTKGSD
ncbi:MAG: glycosyltransferase family 2 protein [Candidatus Aenigmatarchaeota archaeon]|nr:glycosyltransferase family 2 protein [Candidatus Aenigmarchaeota archaeon]